MCTFFIAPDEATLDQYKDDANMILDNLMQNDEFTLYEAGVWPRHPQ